MREQQIKEQHRPPTHILVSLYNRLQLLPEEMAKFISAMITEKASNQRPRHLVGKRWAAAIDPCGDGLSANQSSSAGLGRLFGLRLELLPPTPVLAFSSPPPSVLASLTEASRWAAAAAAAACCCERSCAAFARFRRWYSLSRAFFC